MHTEFRLYGKLDSSYFDLVSGKKEPQQTKGLGLLLSKSPTALKIFLRLLFPRNHINKLLNMPCVIDCEAIQKEESETNKSKRADIIIRFYDEFRPHSAIIVEAKGWDKKAKEEQVLNQVVDYCEKFKILEEFNGKITVVTLTSNPILSSQYKFKNITGEPINITWIDLVNRFLKDNNSAEQQEKELIEDYCNYLLKIGGYMKYYETEVLSIPASNSIKYIEDENIGIYECPSWYGAQKKKALFLTFRAPNSISEYLYKVSEVVIMKLGDTDAIEALAQIDKNYPQRIKKYIEENNSTENNLEEEKRVFFLNTRERIKLPYPCKPRAGLNGGMPQSPVKYDLHAFFQAPNDEGVVILRRPEDDSE